MPAPQNRPRRPRGSPPLLGKDLSQLARWWLGKVQHAKAERRRATVPTKSPRCLADQFVEAVWPWSVTTYPGKFRALAALLGVAPEYARNLMQGRDPLKPWHMRRLADYLEGRIAGEQALLMQLREEQVRLERVRAMRPNIGYVNGIAKWRRERALARAREQRE